MNCTARTQYSPRVHGAGQEDVLTPLLCLSAHSPAPSHSYSCVYGGISPHRETHGIHGFEFYKWKCSHPPWFLITPGFWTLHQSVWLSSLDAAFQAPSVHSRVCTENTGIITDICLQWRRISRDQGPTRLNKALSWRANLWCVSLIPLPDHPPHHHHCWSLFNRITG